MVQPEPERWPGEHAQLTRIVKAKEDRERMLAAMTPEERAKWIEAWAKRVSEYYVPIDTAYDAQFHPPKPPEQP